MEPTADPNGYQTNGTKGANCESVAFTGVPATTLGDWSTANGTDSTAGWVVCTLTYGLLFDDYKGPYSLQGAGDAAEEQKARTVKDYWASIVSDDGQEILFANDYSQLPSNILNIARNGVNAVCWDKPGTGPCPTVRYFYPRPRAPRPCGPRWCRRTTRAARRTARTGRRWRSRRATRPCRAPALSRSARRTRTAPAANSVGFARYAVITGNGGTPADEADVTLNVSITDVRNKVGLADYTGEVEVTSTVRITDRLSGTAENQPATVQDTPFGVTVPCVATGSTTIGGTCSISTTFDAVMPGSILETRRSIWQMGQVTVNDGGADGDVQTGPNTIFAKQGIFIP